MTLLATGLSRQVLAIAFFESNRIRICLQALSGVLGLRSLRANFILDKIKDVLRILQHMRLLRQRDDLEQELHLLVRLQWLDSSALNIKVLSLSVNHLVLEETCFVAALIVHNKVKLLLELIGGQLLGVGLLPLVVERLNLKGVVVLDTGKRRETVCAPTVVEVVGQLD